MAAFVDPLSSEYPVGSLRDLLTVVGHLRANLAGRPQEWENPTLETFLAAMEAWLATFPQSYLNAGHPVPEPDWRFVADVLCAARIYE